MRRWDEGVGMRDGDKGWGQGMGTRRWDEGVGMRDGDEGWGQGGGDVGVG